jgi:hypothetical protein
VLSRLVWICLAAALVSYVVSGVALPRTGQLTQAVTAFTAAAPFAWIAFSQHNGKPHNTESKFVFGARQG